MNYFSPLETSCKCGCGHDIQPALRDKLNQIRTLFGKRIYVTSGARCQSHNAKIGGAPQSAHLTGEAIDLKRDEALLTLITDKLGELGLYMEDPAYTKTWIHIQIRPTKNRIFIPYQSNPKAEKHGEELDAPSEQDMNHSLKHVEDKVLG